MIADNSAVTRQLQLEEEAVQIGVARYREAMQQRPLSELPPGLALLKGAMSPMVQAIEEFKATKGAGRLGHTKKFLRKLDDAEIAFMTIKRVINAIALREPLQRVAISLATWLKDHEEYRRFSSEHPGYLYAVEKNLKTAHMGHRKAVIQRARRKMGVEDTVWTEKDKLHIGVKLIEILIQVTGIAQKVLHNKHYLLVPTSDVDVWLRDKHAVCELLNPLFLPMVVPPRPWNCPYGGGLIGNAITFKSKLVKTRNRKTLMALEDKPMPLIYRAINGLQATPWMINKFVLGVLNDLWVSGDALGGLPTQHSQPLPAKLWDSDDEYAYLKATDPDAIKRWKREATDVYDRRIKEDSKRVALIQKLYVADKLSREAKLYYVWELDFRGRLYPLQTHISPQADDSGKSLIKFANGLPLGERGAYWLMIHLANSYGVDKVSFEDRVAWVQSNARLIIDSASNPLDGDRFWTSADSPFQFLAACEEYAGLDKEGYSYCSHLPIGLDGSCNGLQNFSALLLDEVGGAVVNLIPRDSPADIYQEVADKLLAKVQADAIEGNYYAQLWLNNPLSWRKTVKRGVMTTPYGAKRYGLKDQLMAELLKHDIKISPHEDNFKPCAYLGEKLYAAIGETVIAARNAMDWLQETAKLFSKEGLPITWTTPSGFNVRQEYKKQILRRIKTYWGSSNVQLSLQQDTDKLDKMRQVNGISPNFIHSLDASHLHLTVCKCLDAGITDFAMIHDSYATHAANTDLLNQLLREAFVEQYASKDIMADFREQILAQVPPELAAKIPLLPPKGSLDLSLVLQSKYFFA